MESDGLQKRPKDVPIEKKKLTQVLKIASVDKKSLKKVMNSTIARKPFLAIDSSVTNRMSMFEPVEKTEPWDVLSQNWPNNGATILAPSCNSAILKSSTYDTVSENPLPTPESSETNSMYKKLDVLVTNAAKTGRRPTERHEKAIDAERTTARKRVGLLLTNDKTIMLANGVRFDAQINDVDPDRSSYTSNLATFCEQELSKNKLPSESSNRKSSKVNWAYES
uniref:Uncharacterized protein n=1 Tax=Romanomermis culicivorax TaxID=13658 RepID=A0A915JR13_ROMCU